jgi:NADH dehydrogenase
MAGEQKRVLITGITGLVGRSLVSRLLQSGWRVRGLTRSARHAKELETVGCRAIIGDIRDDHAVEHAISKAHTVIHLVAILRPWRSATYDAITAEGTERVISAAKRAGVERFIYVSALGVSSGDANPYMAAKWQAEEAVRASGLNYTIFRPSYLYGRDGAFLQLLEQLAGLPVIPVIGPGRQKLQILLVEDLADCMMVALGHAPSVGKIYEIGGPEPLEFHQILDAVCRAKGKQPRPKFSVPYALVKPFAALGAALIPTLPATPDTLELLLRDSVCDIGYVRNTFGVRLTPFDEGLKKVLASA